MSELEAFAAQNSVGLTALKNLMKSVLLIS